MANFKPLKNYLIELIDQMVSEYHAQGPFLDAGCGQGDIAEHFAAKEWSGQAIDLSTTAVEQTKIRLKHYPHIIVQQKNILEIDSMFNTVFLCDVLEHIPNDLEVLLKIRKNLNADGKVIISVPILKDEWRWDDNFYGHLRRYEIPEIIELINTAGFKTLAIWDFTWPVFWLIRRVYTRIIPQKIILENNEDKTIKSSHDSAWDQGILTKIFEKIIWWRPIFWLQKKLKNHLIGCEVVIIAEVKK